MIYLISRHPRFSPNSTARDEAIFRAVVVPLAMQGRSVQTLDEDRLPDTLADAEMVLSMGRDTKTLRRLEQVEALGVPVFNRPSALLRNTRSHLDTLIREGGAGLRSLCNSTDVEAIEAAVGYSLWLKRGDACAQTADDVRFVENREQLEAGLQYFTAQGYEDFLASEHVVGDLVKFYGVAETSFFHHTYPTSGGFSKFGLETHNGAPEHHAFSLSELKTKADAIALESGMPIYGGDAIVRADGSFAIIDFNDWPSFGDCTMPAAEAIAAFALSHL